MKSKKQIISVIWVLLGLSVLTLGIAGILDSYWSGVGSSLLIVGILQLIRFRKYNQDPAYRETVDTEAADERNRFIQRNAWSWAGITFVLTAAVASILLRIFGQERLSTLAGLAVCFELCLYWIFFLILRKKY